MNDKVQDIHWTLHTGQYQMTTPHKGRLTQVCGKALMKGNNCTYRLNQHKRICISRAQKTYQRGPIIGNIKRGIYGRHTQSWNRTDNTVKAIVLAQKEQIHNQIRTLPGHRI